MKRLLLILLAMCLCLTFALATACGEDTGGDNPAGNATDDPKTDDGDDDHSDHDCEVCHQEPCICEDEEEPAPAREMVTVIEDVFVYDAARILYKHTFEDMGDWTSRCGGTDPDHDNYGEYEVLCEITDEAYPGGTSSVYVSGRAKNWNGITIDLTEIFTPGQLEYEIYAWVKVPEGQPNTRVVLSYQTGEDLGGEKLTPAYDAWNDYDGDRGILSKRMLPTSLFDPDGEWDVQYNEDYFTEDGWMLLRGWIFINPTEFEEIMVYVESQTGFGDFYLGEIVILTDYI